MVALRVLETIRDMDLPGEVLEAEDPSVTMPRRLGLSDVVERQIRTYRDDMRKGARVADSEVRDLMRLVIRRPDAEEVFYQVGRALASDGPRRGMIRRRMPKALAYALARARLRRTLRKLFGRRVGGFGRGSFTIEGRSLLFIEADPGGDACHLLSGLAETVLSQSGSRPAKVRHTRCQAFGEEVCRWEGEFVDRVTSPEKDDQSTPTRSRTG